MSQVKVRSMGILGVEGFPVEVTVAHVPGGRGVHIVGVSETASKEIAARVRCALDAAGVKFDGGIAVAVTPDGTPPDAAVDLAVAVGAVAALGERLDLDRVVLAGELSLDGALRRIRGALPMALRAAADGEREIVLPAESASEAASVAGVDVFASTRLVDVLDHLRGRSHLRHAKASLETGRFLAVGAEGVSPDLADVRGMETAKRALEIAAAGGHDVILVGPPGSGKSMLARRLPGIMPPMIEREALEASAVYSAAGKLEGSLLVARPFRAPHHSVSVAGLIGGGTVSRPGEVSLAHCGVLFLDELPEFRRDVLEALRQVHEERWATIARSRASVSFPADCLIIGAMNPCPCGYWGSAQRACSCSADQVRRYVSRARVEGFPIVVEMSRADYRNLVSVGDGEPSAAVRDRVCGARVPAMRRAGVVDFGACNARLRPNRLREHCRLDPTTDASLETCVRRYALSGREVHDLLRVARTCADLAGREKISASDVAEAVAFANFSFKRGVV